MHLFTNKCFLFGLTSVGFGLDTEEGLAPAYIVNFILRPYNCLTIEGGLLVSDENVPDDVPVWKGLRHAVDRGVAFLVAGIGLAGLRHTLPQIIHQTAHHRLRVGRGDAHV